jgi:hypothetical protein
VIVRRVLQGSVPSRCNSIPPASAPNSHATLSRLSPQFFTSRLPRAARGLSRSAGAKRRMIEDSFLVAEILLALPVFSSRAKSPLCFQSFVNCPIYNSFVLIFMHYCRGVGGYATALDLKYYLNCAAKLQTVKWLRRSFSAEGASPLAVSA